MVGLSPRVRGSRSGDAFTKRGSGSIPACAGEPRWKSMTIPLNRVYPRVCGGARLLLSTLGIKLGLSPRVRGSPDSLSALYVCDGSIPACAGEPSTPKL